MPATPIAERGYANPDLLADTGWLAAHLDDADLRLIDTLRPSSTRRAIYQARSTWQRTAASRARPTAT